MKIRADTNNENKVPKIGDIFVVTKVEKVAAFWTIELEKRKEYEGIEIGERGYKI